MSRDVHCAPYEVTAFNHRADRRCPCAPVPKRDMNEPSRIVFVHSNPPPKEKP